MGEFRGPGQWLHETNLARRRYALAHPEIVPDDDDEKASATGEFKYRPGQPRDAYGRFSETGQSVLPGMLDLTDTSVPASLTVITTASGRVVGPSTPEAMNAAVKRVNPTVQGGQRSVLQEMNCQYCTGAYEMRRRGYDVTAVPHMASRPDQFTEWFSRDGQSPSPTRPFAGRYDRGWTPRETHTAVSAHLVAKYPEGARGAISFAATDYQGHVMNWERNSAGVDFVDSQIGEVLGVTDPILRAMGQRPYTITEYQLNNCELTPSAGEAVM